MADNTKGLDDVLNSDERPTKENLVGKFFQLEQSMKILANSLRDIQMIDALRQKESMAYYKKIDQNFKRLNLHDQALEAGDVEHNTFKKQLTTMDKKAATTDAHIRVLQKAAKELKVLQADVRMLEVTKADATQFDRCQAKIMNETPTLATFEAAQAKTEEALAQIAADAVRFSVKFNKFGDEMRETDMGISRRIEEISNCQIEHTHKISKLGMQMTARCADIEALQEQVFKRATCAAFDDLSAQFRKFSSIESVERITEYLLPRLERFSEQCGQLYASNQEIKEVVQQFDEDLSLKYNKGDHILFKNQMDEIYMKHNEDWPKLLARFAEIDKEKENRDKRTETQIKEYQARMETIADETITEQMAAKLQQYEKVRTSFEPFFDAEDLGSLLDRKADLELIRRIQEQKAERTELGRSDAAINGMNIKLKHISVFQAEVAKMLLPSKQSGKFKHEEDLTNSIKQREQIIHQGLLMCNWINKTNVNDAEATPRYAQVAKVTDKLDKKKAIKVITMGDTSVRSKVGGRTQLVSRESSQDSKEDGEPGNQMINDISKSFYSTSGVDNQRYNNLGRKRGVLSGCSTKRRQATFGVLSNDFNEAIKSSGRFGFINTARKRAPTTARNLSRPQSNAMTPVTIPTSERHLSPTFLTSDISIEDHHKTQPRPSKSQKNQFLTMRKMSQGTHHRKPSQLNSANRGIKIITNSFINDGTRTPDSTDANTHSTGLDKGALKFMQQHVQHIRSKNHTNQEESKGYLVPSYSSTVEALSKN